MFKLPSITVPGLGRLSACLVNWKTAIEWSCNLTGSGLCRVDKAAAGPVIHVDIPYGVGGLVMKATTQISARSGANYGTGSAVIEQDNGTSLSDGTGTQTVKNLLNQTYKNGARFIALRVGDDYWLVAPDDCASVGA